MLQHVICHDYRGILIGSCIVGIILLSKNKFKAHNTYSPPIYLYLAICECSIYSFKTGYDAHIIILRMFNFIATDHRSMDHACYSRFKFEKMLTYSLHVLVQITIRLGI